MSNVWTTAVSGVYVHQTFKAVPVLLVSRPVLTARRHFTTALYSNTRDPGLTWSRKQLSMPTIVSDELEGLEASQDISTPERPISVPQSLFEVRNDPFGGV